MLILFSFILLFKNKLLYFFILISPPNTLLSFHHFIYCSSQLALCMFFFFFPNHLKPKSTACHCNGVDTCFVTRPAQYQLSSFSFFTNPVLILKHETSHAYDTSVYLHGSQPCFVLFFVDYANLDVRLQYYQTDSLPSQQKQ